MLVCRVSCLFTRYGVCLQGIMLVYDITNEKSFENIRNWIRNIEEVLLTCHLIKCKTVEENVCIYR